MGGSLTGEVASLNSNGGVQKAGSKILFCFLRESITANTCLTVSLTTTNRDF
jgi:hypothetical protein